MWAAPVVAGIELMGARGYDPATASFLSVDPLAPVAGAVWGSNPYSFAGNNPVMMSDPWGLRPATDADLVAYREANQGFLADAGDWVADNWEYVVAGAMVVAGGVLMATGVGGPVGAMLISGGFSMGMQKVTTGSVDPLQLAMDMVPGGVIVQGLAGAGAAAYSYMKSPGPHNVAGFMGDVAVAGLGAALPGPSAGGKRVVGEIADAAADSGGAQAVRAVTPSPHLRAGSVGLDGGDVSSGVGKLGDVSPRPSVGEGVIYYREDLNGVVDPYVGQSKDLLNYDRRQYSHNRQYKNANFQFTELEVNLPEDQLSRYEQYWMREMGGPTTKANPDGLLSNKRWEMSPERYEQAGGDPYP